MPIPIPMPLERSDRLNEVVERTQRQLAVADLALATRRLIRATATCDLSVDEVRAERASMDALTQVLSR